MTRIGKKPTRSKPARKSGTRKKPSKSSREKAERKKPKTAPGVKAERKTPPGVKVKGKTASGVKVKGKTAPGVKAKRKTPPAAKAERKTPSGVKVKRKTPPGVKVKGKTAPGVKVKGKTTPGAKAKRKTPPDVKAKRKTPPDVKAKRKTPPDVKAKRKTPPGAKRKTPPGAKAKRKTPPGAKAKKIAKKPTRLESTRLKQGRAHRSALFYAHKLGKRKAAARLGATVAELERWLEKGFPTKKIEDAIGLGKVGGSFTIVQKTDLKKLKKKISGKKLAELTGIPESEINARIKAAKKKPALVRFHRDALKRAQKDLGKEKLSELLGVKERALDAARKVPQTLLTGRLARFTAIYGVAGIASMLGLSESTIKRWLSTNIPRKWESEVVSLIGRRPDQGVSEEKLIKPRKKRDLGKIFKESWRNAKKWNKRVPPSFRVCQKTVERWIRIGKFDENFQKAKAVYGESQKIVPAYDLPPEPPPIPEPPEPSLFKKPLPPLPKPPKPQKIPQSITEIEQKSIADFQEARAEAFFKGIRDEHRPPDPWGRPTYVELTHRKAWRVFKKVEKFSHLINMGKIGNEIIEGGRRIWPKISGRNEYMTIRFTFSALGAGNPFYPEAWFPDKENFEFFTRSTDVIYDVREIDFRVRAILNEVWDASKEIGLLFLEHYEIIKSTSK